MAPSHNKRFCFLYSLHNHRVTSVHNQLQICESFNSSLTFSKERESDPKPESERYSPIKFRKKTYPEIRLTLRHCIREPSGNHSGISEELRSS